MPRSRFSILLALSLLLTNACAEVAATLPERPFTMTLDGGPAAPRLEKTSPGAGGESRWRDRESGVVASVTRAERSAFGATEWTLRLTNTAQAQSPLIADIWSGEFDVDLDPGPAPELFSSKGSSDLADDFQPSLQTLAAAKPIALASFGGRSSDGTMPYFNVFGGTKGAIVAVGWTGNWRAEVTHASPGTVRVRIGMQRASFRLHPGETVRLPAVMVMPWTGDRMSSHNKFRRLMLAHYTPQNHPPMDLTPIAASPHLMIGFNDTNESNLLKFVEQVHAARLGIDTIWLDAGWNEGGFAEKTGNPEPDPARFPNGLKPVADRSHKLGFRYLQWFEVERVMAGTSLAREHPDWLLESSENVPRLAYQKSFRLLDLGNPEAYKWTLEYLTRHIRETGIDIYRQDSNIYPSFFWHTDEPKDRIGIREIRHIEGLYAMLDALQERFPKLVIDNCASGGRRLDFEMMRRSTPYFRSDYIWGRPEYPRSAQAMTLGISYWLPLSGNGTISTNLADFASGMGAPFVMAINFADAKVNDAMRPRIEQLKRVRSLYAEDFYPLTDYSLDPTKLIAVQYHDPKADRGFVMAYGRTIDLSQLRPRGLTAGTYEWSDWSLPGETRRLPRTAVETSGLMSLDGEATRRDVVVMEYRAAQE